MEETNKPKKIRKHGKKKLQQVMGTKEMLDPLTGEIVQMTVIQKNMDVDHGFHKIWLEDLMNILNSMGNRKMTILSYLLRIMRNSDNTLNFTMRSLSEDTGVSLQTCQTTISELIESNVLKRDKRVKQLYTFNPDLVVKGDSKKRRMILVEYNYEDQSQDTLRARQLEEKFNNEDIIEGEIETPQLTTKEVMEKWEEHKKKYPHSYGENKGLGEE